MSNYPIIIINNFSIIVKMTKAFLKEFKPKQKAHRLL